MWQLCCDWAMYQNDSTRAMLAVGQLPCLMLANGDERVPRPKLEIEAFWKGKRRVTWRKVPKRKPKWEIRRPKAEIETIE